MATLIGTFFLISLFATGITAQSQAGMKKPIKIPTILPKTGFLGINFAIISLEMYLSITEEIRHPKSRNGNASKKIETNKIAILLKTSIFAPFLKKTLLIVSNKIILYKQIKCKFLFQKEWNKYLIKIKDIINLVSKTGAAKILKKKLPFRKLHPIIIFCTFLVHPF